MLTKYKCTECEREDSDRGHNPPVPQALICWNCKAGTKMTVSDQSGRGYGMIPLVQFELTHQIR